ncbi:MAG: hypothetical protein Q4B85_13145 [Lachnospiraceae bacterium]|nr:hypothetical protein [Lachnospiraceae bacterium]
MKAWTKPELYIEEFQLEQHIAAGCGTITIPPEAGGSVTGSFKCTQIQGQNPKGHWDLSDLTVTDINGDGRIVWDEIMAAAEEYNRTALNGQITGNGHQNHAPVFQLPGGETVVHLNS